MAHLDIVSPTRNERQKNYARCQLTKLAFLYNPCNSFSEKLHQRRSPALFNVSFTFFFLLSSLFGTNLKPRLRKVRDRYTRMWIGISLFSIKKNLFFMLSNFFFFFFFVQDCGQGLTVSSRFQGIRPQIISQPDADLDCRIKIVHC